ncbi:MAG: Uma2 family endonuclease [Verrucomicrobia bacterium]|nr:Uma2 family endonuclease [Verrucomicrobiota bacterium]
MAVTLAAPSKRSAVPPLENGDRLSAHEFLRRYEAMPEVKKAELINGVVYMPSPVRLAEHAEPDNAIQWWLKHYSIHTPGTRAGSNATTRLGPDDVPQPDALLRIVPESGGQARVDAKGYLQGPPELVVEIAASSVSIDAGEKLRSYRRAGVLEYILWRTVDSAVDWWALEEDEYRPMTPDAAGLLRSRVFPGLWLDVRALLANDGARLQATLEAGLRDAAHEQFVRQLRSK